MHLPQDSSPCCYVLPLPKTPIQIVVIACSLNPKPYTLNPKPELTEYSSTVSRDAALRRPCHIATSEILEFMELHGSKTLADDHGVAGAGFRG